MKIIVINGQGGVGKDTFVGYCGYEDEGVYNYSMISGVKRIAESFGWCGGKAKEDRKFLSDLKDLAAEYSDFPFQDTLRRMKADEHYYNKSRMLSNNNAPERICFVHSREPRDIERWKTLYGAKTLLIRREQVEGTYGNHADDNVFDIDYDYVFWNNGDLYQLKDQAEKFIAQIREEEWESNINGKND